MRIPTCIIYFFAILQLHSNTVFSQRDFANPAVSDPAACACDLRANKCDPNCCCDSDCSDNDLRASPICQSTRTTTSDSSSSAQLSLQKWNCSNSTSAALYDYFPFVCVQLTLNEIYGNFYSTEGVVFVNTIDSATNLRSNFANAYPELFQPATLSLSAFTRNYVIGAPVRQATGTSFTLPGSLAGSVCQENVEVLFGVNRDISCASSTLVQDLCTRINNVKSVMKGGGTNSNVSFSFFTKNYVSSLPTPRDLTTEYYFDAAYTSNINNITSVNGRIFDYCPGDHPNSRTQRYLFVCASTNANTSCPGDQTWSQCPLRDTLRYRTIPDAFFTARSTSTDSSTNFADFINATNGTSITCTGNDIRRVFYRFTYSSIDNTISAVDVFALLQSSSSNPRITIEWNDIAANTTSSSSVPRGYRDGEVLQLRRNNAISDVSILSPTSNGLCIDASRQTLQYKQSTSSYCFVQLRQNTIQQCHNLKLNMYLYLNAFYAPASDVLAYPYGNTSLIQIRDDTQDSLDLDRIDVTRPNNRLDRNTIARTNFRIPSYTIYDTTATLPTCYNVPSGIYIEFGFVRINISSTVSYERIISVQYNYTYSNWQFDCAQSSCNSTTTQRYLVSFQSAFVDYTNRAFNLGETRRSDLTSADNYIQHLLWLISPEYKGEPGYRNYTIAMILIFIAICIIVMHILLFGLMFPF